MRLAGGITHDRARHGALSKGSDEFSDSSAMGTSPLPMQE